MRKFSHNGHTMQYVVPASTVLTVDQAILFGTVLFFVHSTNNSTATAAAGEEVTLVSYGVFVAKKTAGSGTGWAIGAKVYWDTSTLSFTGISGGSVAGATATIAITTAAALNDTLSQLTANGVALLATPMTFVADGTVLTELQIANAINAYSAVTGYTAAATTNVVTVTGPTVAKSATNTGGASINGLTITTGTVTGTMVLNTANGASAAFSGGVNGSTSIEIGYGWDVVAGDNDTSATVKLRIG